MGGGVGWWWERGVRWPSAAPRPLRKRGGVVGGGVVWCGERWVRGVEGWNCGDMASVGVQGCLLYCLLYCPLYCLLYCLLCTHACQQVSA